MNWIVKNFVRGLLIVVPVGLTVYLVYQAFVAADRIVPLRTPGLGIAVLVAATILVGALASNYVGRKLVQLMEAAFARAPIVRIIYAAIRDLLEAFVGKERRFQSPVTVMLADQVKVFGFITRDDLGALGDPGEVAVYVPFSYTWDGCLLVVPRERVRPLQADSANILALVVSGGVARAK